MPDRILKRQRVGHAPHIARHVGERLRFELRENLPHGDDGRAIVARSDGCLRGFEQQARLARGRVCRAQFEFRRSVEGDRAQRIRARLPLRRGERNRSIELRYRRNRRNRIEHIRFFDWPRRPAREPAAPPASQNNSADSAPLISRSSRARAARLPLLPPGGQANRAHRACKAIRETAADAPAASPRPQVAVSERRSTPRATALTSALVDVGKFSSSRL